MLCRLKKLCWGSQMCRKSMQMFETLQKYLSSLLRKVNEHANPREIDGIKSCFLTFNEVCTAALKLVLVEAGELHLDLEGVDSENPARSTKPLQKILVSLESSKQYTTRSVLDPSYSNLDKLLQEFYEVACRSEVHILLGAYRSKCAQSFLVNPCSCFGETPLDEFYEFIENSHYLGAVLKALYLTNILGISFATGHDLSLAVFDNEKYPRLPWFTDFGMRVHVTPV